MSREDEFEQIWNKLRDPEYRKQFIDEFIDVGIAFQIRQIRERQNLTQAQLAKKMGNEKKQPLLSSWENPDYGKYTLATLKDLARAFDLGLLVRFVPLSKLVDWTVDITSETIAPPNFEEEDGRTLARNRNFSAVNAADSQTDMQTATNAAELTMNGVLK